MQTHALTKAREDEYGSFEYWLNGKGLSAPPLWLADLRGPKPLEDRLWFTPQVPIDLWIESVSDDDFIEELGLTTDDGMIVVGGNHDTRSRNFRLIARIATALVSPHTAAALVRALQTVDDSWDYRIPPAGHDLEIDTSPYRLVGWLEDVPYDLGIDERDPLRCDVHAIGCRPSSMTTKTLGLKFVCEDEAGWVEASGGKRVFIYEAWGDIHSDERDDGFHYDDTVRSSGWRLRVDKDTLMAFLNKMGLDLIVEIEITRRNKGYDYPQHNEEEPKEARFDKVIVLRGDGTIEAAEGRLGTWTASRK